MAEAAREAGVDVLRYPSARDREGVNIALLACRAFATPEPIERRRWRLHMNAYGVRAFCEHPEARLEFGRDAFAVDPRIRRLRWERPPA